jgi:hypothetical protein
MTFIDANAPKCIPAGISLRQEERTAAIRKAQAGRCAPASTENFYAFDSKFVLYPGYKFFLCRQE